MFPDHNEYLRRDKVDTKQYYKAELDFVGLEGQAVGASPSPPGARRCIYNKKLFDAKGVKYPHKDWTYDEFLDACQQAERPREQQVGRADRHRTASTTCWARSCSTSAASASTTPRTRPSTATTPRRDPGRRARRGHPPSLSATRPTPEAVATVPTGKAPFDVEMVAMEINGVFRHTNARAGIGAQNLDFAPPPKGPGGQTASVAGNAWSIVQLSKAQGGGLEGPEVDPHQGGHARPPDQGRRLAAPDLGGGTPRSGRSSSRAPRSPRSPGSGRPAGTTCWCSPRAPRPGRRPTPR